ncbi:putative ribonuclease H-like domain-containing protein [Tanacetum coccineum]
MGNFYTQAASSKTAANDEGCYGRKLTLMAGGYDNCRGIRKRTEQMVVRKSGLWICAMMALTEVEQVDGKLEFDAVHVHFGQDGIGDFGWEQTKVMLHQCLEPLMGYKSEDGLEILGYQMCLESLESFSKHMKERYAWGFGVESSSSMESDNSSGNTNSTESFYPKFSKDKRIPFSTSTYRAIQKEGSHKIMLLLTGDALEEDESQERNNQDIMLKTLKQALHDELVSLMHQESLAKSHNDAQRNAFEEEKRRIALEKGKDTVNSTFTLSTADTPSQSTGNTPTDSDDDVPKDEEPKKVSQALADESWVEAMQEELLQFKLQDVWVAQGYRQEEGVNYDEVFAPVARIEAIRLFLAFASFMGFTVYQMDVKSAFLYGKHLRSGVVKQPPRFEDHAHPNKVYKSSKSSFMLTSSQEHGFKSTPKVSHINAVKRIFWVVVNILEEAGLLAMQETTICGYIPLQRAEYVAAAVFVAQVLWMQNQLLDYGFNFMNTEIHIDNESTICIVKNPVLHSKTKHIQIRHHFIRDCYEQRLINVVKVHTDDNVADLLTKGFDLARFNFLVVTIGMMNP